MSNININRLEYICGKELNIFQKQKLHEWANTFAETTKGEIKRHYEQEYEKELLDAVECFVIAIAFVLHFNEKTKFGKKRIFDVLRDVQATVDLFGTKEYSPKDYEKMLKDDGINLNIKLR